MTGQKFADLIRFYTRTNTTTFPAADITLLANAIKDDFAKQIMKANEDLFGIPATRDLVDSSELNEDGSSPREYDLPSDCIAIKRLEALFDGENWVKLTEKDLTEFRSAINNESIITSKFSNNEGSCHYEIFRNSLWIYSGTIEAVEDGLKLWGIFWPANLGTNQLTEDITDLSADPSQTSSQLPRQFHELWARKVSMTWKSSREKPIPLSQIEQSFDKDWDEAMASITNSNMDREILGHIPSDAHLQY